MTDILVGLFTWAGAVVTHLGWKGTFLAVVAGFLFYFLVKFLDRADRLAERAQRRWRTLSKPTRWSIGLVGLVVAGPSLWAAFPKSTGTVIVCVSLYVAYCYQGWRFIERYDLEAVTFWQAWNHHLDVTRAARRHTAAIGDATTKKGGKARKPRPHETGESFVAEPPYGMSADELATEYNEGRMTSAEAARRGWGEVRGVNATPMPDGTVLVNIDRVDPDGGEPLEEAKWWTP